MLSPGRDVGQIDKVKCTIPPYYSMLARILPSYRGNGSLVLMVGLLECVDGGGI